jgi:RNA-directed DNA polymerase
LIISEMQHKLATWASADQTRRFDRLLRLITDRNWLAEAARIVLASSGASTPGLDGMDKRRLAADLEHHLERLRVALLDGTYCPTPVKRIHIPKANGKLRPLGIPILLDRIVQRAMLMAMEPIWRATSTPVPTAFVLNAVFIMRFAR